MSTHRGASGFEPATGLSATGRSALGMLALGLTVLSIIGFVLLAIGSIADWRGFSDDPDDNSTFADVVWSTFALAGILALLAGIAAWVRGRSRHLCGDVRAGQLAVGWVVFALILSVIISALD